MIFSPSSFLLCRSTLPALSPPCVCLCPCSLAAVHQLCAHPLAPTWQPWIAQFAPAFWWQCIGLLLALSRRHLEFMPGLALCGILCLHLAFPCSLGSNASGFAAVSFSALLAGLMLAVPL